MNNSPKQIVIIEDDAVLRRGLRRIFIKDNFEVFDFENGKQGVDQIGLSKPDLILCDYKLSDTNGLEILKKIRETDWQTPFFLMTGYYKDKISDEANENGASIVFEKPLNLNELKKSCRKILQG